MTMPAWADDVQRPRRQAPNPKIRTANSDFFMGAKIKERSDADLTSVVSNKHLHRCTLDRKSFVSDKDLVKFLGDGRLSLSQPDA
jgi:hypothetical protein